MNWRRGLLFAGIHLVIAGTLIAWHEAALQKGSLAFVQTKGLTYMPDPCGAGFMENELDSSQRTIVSFANFPAASLTGWIFPCPSGTWTLAGRFESTFGYDTFKLDLRIAIIMSALVPIQWILIGGFPLVDPRRWWMEPGVLITICTALSLLLVLTPASHEISPLPMLFAVLAWLYWFSLLIWKILRSGWRLLIPSKA